VSGEGFDLKTAHLRWVLLVMEQDKATNSVNVGLLSTETVMFETDRVADLVEQL